MKQFQFSKIKEYREAAGMGQKDLAEKIGVSPQQLWNWENSSNDKSLTTEYLGKIATTLKKRTDDFFVEQRNI
ncbi:MAG TPA: helix-turn-helix transcriptional regulator [Candidatus Wunengus sp. YC60]|uniref:helix-turn-helix transcriptional regulator n=1 Tax=Candidatus Wunengus sp. YC60 TaxID=3367697 RepID=UPI0040260751